MLLISSIIIIVWAVCLLAGLLFMHGATRKSTPQQKG